MILAFTAHSTNVGFKVCILLWKNQTCFFFLFLHNFVSSCVQFWQSQSLGWNISYFSKKGWGCSFFFKEDQRASCLMAFVNISLSWIMVSMPHRLKNNVTLPPKCQLFCTEELPKSLPLRLSHQTHRLKNMGH